MNHTGRMASEPLSGTSPTTSAGPLLAADSAFDGVVAKVPQRLAAVLDGLAVGELRALGASSSDQVPSTPYTLLTLFTADGLLEALEWANVGQPADENACLWLAYLRWLRHQEATWPDAAPSPLPRWLDSALKNGFPAPARASVVQQSLEALSTGAMGEVQRPVLPQAQDPDVLLRSVVLGLLPTGWKSVTAMTVNGAAITHGHPEAQVAAVGAALMVQATVTAALRGDSQPLSRALTATLEVLPQVTRPGRATVEALQTVLRQPGRSVAHDDEVAGTCAAEAPDQTGTAASTATQTLAAGVRAALQHERDGRSALVAESASDPAVEALACALVGAAGGRTALSGAGRPAVPEAVVAVIEQMAERWGAQLGVSTEPAT